MRRGRRKLGKADFPELQRTEYFRISGCSFKNLHLYNCTHSKNQEIQFFTNCQDDAFGSGLRRSITIHN